jgi:hypothetical protein
MLVVKVKMNLKNTDQVAATPAMAKRIEFWPLDRLQPYARNARPHSEEEITNSRPDKPNILLYSIDSFSPTTARVLSGY